MARIIIAVVYIAAILVIGILAGRNVKTSEEFATANRGIPFWTNVFSMSSAWIGAGSTLGCASMCYAYGVSGFYLAIGVGIGAMLSSLLFARKIRDENVSTIPELIRKHLGNKCADAIALLSIFSVFSVVASQIRSLGTILNMFVPQLSLLTAMIIMTAVMLVYTVIGGMVAATKTDKVNIILMVFAVVMVLPLVALIQANGMAGVTAALQESRPEMLKVGATFGTSNMINNENFLRICGAKSGSEARNASLTATLLIYVPYLLFASLIGLVGAALIPELGTSDSILPAMINNYTGTFLGAILLAALLAAVMGTAASVTMVCSIMLSRDVVGRFKKMDDKQTLTLQRIFMILVAIAGLIVGYFGSSIVSIMEDVGAPAGAALVPIFCGIFYWRKKMNEKGTLITIVVAIVSTLGYWALGSPLGISHFLFGLICAAITMFVANSACYVPKQETEKAD